MLHKRAAQRADGTGWQYVLGKGNGGAPIGYCREHAPHASEDEARECYSQYVRDSVRLNAGSGGWTSCNARNENKRFCPNPAQAFATYGDDGYGLTWLCPEHMTHEQVVASAQLDGPAGDAWVS